MTTKHVLGVGLRTDMLVLCLVFAAARACARCTRVGGRHCSYWRDNSVCPSEEDYIHMVTHKTGGLFRLSVSLMQVLRAFRPPCRLPPTLSSPCSHHARQLPPVPPHQPPLLLCSHTRSHAGCAHATGARAGV